MARFAGCLLLLLAMAAWPQAAAALEADERPQEATPEPAASLTLGGALRSNFYYTSWADARGSLWPEARGSLWAFDTFRLNADGAYGPLFLSSEYRFYAGYQFLHHGYVGYRFAGPIALHAGVTKAPFGLLPFGSHNWFFLLPYYLGFEDDYDLGVKLLATEALWGLPLDLQLAFFKNDEGTFTGSSLDSARYSYDMVRTREGDLAYAGFDGATALEETNQGNVRAAYTLAHGPIGQTTLGASGQVGAILDRQSGAHGFRWAAAAHLEGQYDRINLMLEWIRYGFEPANGGTPSVTMGAYDAPYQVASFGTLYVAGLAYTLPFTFGPFSEILAYHDYSLLNKDQAGFAPSQMNVTGMRLTAGPFVTYLDLAAGQNHPWLGPGYGSALAEGRADAPWEFRLNLNQGYYF